LKLELHWLERGVTARRRRNQGRLTKLHEMRAQRAAMLGPQGNAKLALAKEDVKTKTVIDAEHVTKAYGDRTIIRDFSLRVQRGDRIGIVGANGAGKTTLLKLLTGEIQPDSGLIKQAKTLNGIVIDQQRKLMAPDKRVREVLAEGGDWIGDSRTPHPHQGLSEAIPVRPEPQRSAGGVTVGRRAVAAAAGARIRSRVEPAGARRADQRPRSRDAGSAPGSDRRL
jgi:ATPase subunit of ABC transporter with duplicated ATPase domains